MISKHKGQLAARFLKTAAVSQGSREVALSYIDNQRWTDGHQLKAAVDAMTLGNASSLAADIGADFLEVVSPETLIGRIENLRYVPFQVRTVRQTSRGAAYWVAENAPKPLSAASFSSADELPPRKVVAMSVISNELARASDAEAVLLRDLAQSAAQAMDEAFIDPSNAGVPEERPSSVTYGATAIDASSNPAADVKAATAALLASGGNLRTAAWVLHPDQAVALHLRGGAFETVGALGGSIAGIPAFTSSSVPVDSAASPIVLLDANGIEVGGGNETSLRSSNEASILMDTDPTSENAKMVSLWHTNSIALLAEILINWRIARPGSVVRIDGAKY